MGNPKNALYYSLADLCTSILGVCLPAMEFRPSARSLTFQCRYNPKPTTVYLLCGGFRGTDISLSAFCGPCNVGSIVIEIWHMQYLTQYHGTL